MGIEISYDRFLFDEMSKFISWIRKKKWEKYFILSSAEFAQAFIKLKNKYGKETCQRAYITLTCLYNFDPINLSFYIVKLGFPGINIIFLIIAQKHRLWVLVRTA